jgi:TrmH family RNA methyltransferase
VWSEHVAFVLVRPQRPQNVAAACRALKNMGFRDLRLVDAAIDRGDAATRAPAYGAWDVLDGAREHPTLLDAVADCAVAVGCSGRAGEAAWTPRELADRAPALAVRGRLAVVFGPEKDGLTNAELRLLPHHVRIPTAPEQPSLNLAQAVLLLAYELRLASLPFPDTSPGPVAEVGEMETALGELRDGLLGIGYLNAQNPEAILAELRVLLARAAPSPREAQLLRGLARQLRWAGERIAERRPGRS